MEQEPKHLEPSTTDMADQEPSAAAKVFVVPELVENILEKLAEDDDIDDLQPLTCISAVQRVSTLFHDTITNSKKIQRLMATPLDDIQHGRIHLFQGALRLCIAECDNYYYMVYCIQMDFEEKHHEKFKSGKFREGSWRNVRIQEESETGIEVTMFSERLGEGIGEFFLDCDATLGDLVDGYFAAEEAEREWWEELEREEAEYDGDE